MDKKIRSGQVITSFSIGQIIAFPNNENLMLYGVLTEAFSYLKGPMDMLQLYEGKYKEAVQLFAAEQVGRRRRDDYTDGTVRIPIQSPPQ